MFLSLLLKYIKLLKHIHTNPESTVLIHVALETPSLSHKWTPYPALNLPWIPGLRRAHPPWSTPQKYVLFLTSFLTTSPSDNFFFHFPYRVCEPPGDRKCQEWDCMHTGDSHYVFAKWKNGMAGMTKHTWAVTSGTTARGEPQRSRILWERKPTSAVGEFLTLGSVT